MKLVSLHASLMALALFAAGTAHAASDTPPPDMVLAQAENGDASAEFEQVQKFLASGRDLAQMDEQRLAQRLKRAKRFQQIEGLPPELQGELQQEIAAINAEIERRQQAAAEAPAAQPEAQPQQDAAEEQQPKRERRKQVAEDAAPQQEQPVAQDSPEVTAFLSAIRPAVDLSEEELRRQIQQAGELAKIDGLSEDQRRALRDVIREGRAELRNKANTQDAARSEQPTPEAQAQPKQEDQAAAPQPQGSDEVAAFLGSVKPASELSEEALRQQMQRATELAGTDGLSPDQRRALRDVIREARAELRNNSNGNQDSAATEQPKAEQNAAPQPQDSEEVAVFLSTAKPAAELSGDALREQMRRATELAGKEGLPPDQRSALRDVIREARAKLRTEGNDGQQAGQPPQQQTQQQPGQQAGQAVQVDPELESRALAIVNDKVDVTTMDRRELRQRLRGIRDLLASDKLSPQTTDALRKKLAAERQVLRNEVSDSEGSGRQQQQGSAEPNKPPKGQGQGNGTGGTTANNNVTVNNNTTITNTEIRVVLQDRRPPDVLDQEELVRRIDVYREVVDDESYAEEERIAWERELARDRRELRRRMLDERRMREERLRDAEIDIDIGDRYDPRREVPDDVFAAEVDDEELTDVLAAPPRRKLQRRYTVDEIARSPEARDAVARIEIDTVHFGFGEGFLREEEIDKLDRIAQVLERILAKNPEEVFMIEGHTDAVGSDASNLVLSRERAQAVKEALTTYYVIPAQNLKTVGLGERYLKIPTQKAEAENRRVSLARITALVGQAD